MARPLRIEYAGALYHVTSRGNAQQNIFLNDDNRNEFLQLICLLAGQFNFLLHSYCLMDNHYHLLIETGEANLSRVMRQLNGVYTQKFNRRHSRVGHLFQGRYKAILVEKQSYLLELSRYIVLNPVRASIVSNPEDWKWSSYRSFAGLENKIPCLSTDWILSLFNTELNVSQAQYVHFVNSYIDKESPLKLVKGQCILGSQEFIESMESNLADAQTKKEIPVNQRMVTRPTLQKLIKYDEKLKALPDSLHVAHFKHGYTLSEISFYCGLHYTTVSKAIKKLDENRNL